MRAFCLLKLCYYLEFHAGLNTKPANIGVSRSQIFNFKKCSLFERGKQMMFFCHLSNISKPLMYVMKFYPVSPPSLLVYFVHWFYNSCDINIQCAMHISSPMGFHSTCTWSDLITHWFGYWAGLCVWPTYHYVTYW